MTEPEAKTKWCPQFRMTSEASQWAHNREGSCECIASECAWWVREYKGAEMNKDGSITVTPQGECEYIGGHCGAIK